MNEQRDRDQQQAGREPQQQQDWTRQQQQPGQQNQQGQPRPDADQNDEAAKQGGMIDEGDDGGEPNRDGE
jgi:hypothetical protein